MATQDELKLEPKSKGLPLWTVLVALLILAAVVIGGLGYFIYSLRSSKAKVERQLQAVQVQQKEAELAQKRAVEDSKLTLARNHQEQLLAQIRAATNVLQKLLADADKLRADADTLKTDASGKAIGVHPDLVTLSRRFYESELPTLPSRDDIVVRLESVRRIEQQLASNLGTAYEPTADLPVTVQTATLWGEEESAKVAKLRQELSSLVQESKAREGSSPAAAHPEMTLEVAILKLNTADADSKLRMREETTSAAKSAAEIERAKAEADKDLAAAKQEADAVRTKIREENAKAELDRNEREAALKLEETKSRVAVETKADEAQKVVLRKKAADPKVQVVLGPFITPGYIHIRTIEAEKKPLSYSELKSYGALTPGVGGLSQLVKIASHPADKVRPRWKMNHQLFMRSPEQLEKATEAQNLLIELGPVLVEMKLLEP